MAIVSLSLWTLFLAVTLTGAVSLFRQLKKQHPTPLVPAILGVSILKPLKGADANLFLNLESFVLVSTEIAHEILFSVESRNDPAFAIVSRLISLYPDKNLSLFISENSTEIISGKNPKLRNIHQSFLQAKFDAVLISDSNVRLKAGELEALVSELDEKAGMVTALVSGVDFQGLGGALESVFLGTFYARFMALCNRYAKPCVVGKAMLFRKSDCARFGGLALLSEFLAEDFVAGETMRKLGLHIRTSRVPVSQILGRYSIKTFWGRHVRWGRIRKSHAPLAFIAEPFFSSLAMSILGAYGLHFYFNLILINAFFASGLVLCFLDLLCYLRTTKCSILFGCCFPLIWTLREGLALPLWIKIASGNDIDWRGNRFVLAPGGLLRDK